jgi:hypothetical protein
MSKFCYKTSYLYYTQTSCWSHEGIRLLIGRLVQVYPTRGLRRSNNTAAGKTVGLDFGYRSKPCRFIWLSRLLDRCMFVMRLGLTRCTW